MRTLKAAIAVFLFLGLICGGCGSAKPAKAKKKAAAKSAKSGAPERRDVVEEEPAPAAPVGPPTTTLDLSAVGIEATMEVPEGAEAKMSEWEEVTIEKAPGFNIGIMEADTPLAERKQEIEANDVNKLKEFLLADRTTLFYSSEVMGKEEYHFVKIVKAGGKTYMLEDTKGPAYTREQAETMLKAASSMESK